MDRLRKRRDFLAAAKADRAGGALFLMQGRDRGDAADVRVGFTVTKKIGNAVVRNRIRRRLREAVRHVLPASGRPGFDYVLVAREGALHAPFDALVKDIARAVRKLNAPERPRGAGGRRPRKASEDQQTGAPDPDVSDHQPTPADGGPPA